ncbi:MAG TPA: lysophospholipid acyltransferase family protein [Isosphaeraceae bacterium]|jgi:1-acyl-sn-glycerol-3-phosphate acyltransferase|nr:lysophospholipid acyltransferase family protein [Isosphaeraceae bacterium]
MMSPSLLLLLALAILVVPWWLMPRRPGPRPEIHGLLRVLWWINAAYCALMHRLEAGGPAPLPEQGPAILIANHTCGIDHMILQAGCQRVLGFMIAQEFYNWWPCRPFCKLLDCISVKRDGHDVAATRAALRALKQGRVVPIFPEGRITPRSGLVIAEGKPGAAFIALHARVPVIPAYICGTPPTNDVLKSLVTPSNAKVIYGPPIALEPDEFPEPFDKATLAAATDRLMAAILALRAKAMAGEEHGRAGMPASPEPDDRRPERHLDAVPADRPALVTA